LSHLGAPRSSQRNSDEPHRCGRGEQTGAGQGNAPGKSRPGTEIVEYANGQIGGRIGRFQRVEAVEQHAVHRGHFAALGTAAGMCPQLVIPLRTPALIEHVV
jgi:hypothetical protein